MDIPIEHEGFSGRGLTLRCGSFFKGPRLWIDGAEVKGKRLKFSLRDNSGNPIEARLRSNGLDPIPKVELGGRIIELVRPLAWYEYVWMGLPIALVFTGGGLGALFGIVAVYSSAHVFRSGRSTVAKFAISALISLGAAVAFFLCAIAVHLFFGRPAANGA